jgi:hypothetical protein
MNSIIALVDDHSEFIHWLSSCRTAFFSKMISMSPIPRVFIENKALPHVLCIISVVSFISSIFSATRRLTLFSLHPVLICIGIFLFLGEGIILSKNRLLFEWFEPIMSGSRKRKLRNLHMSLQIIGTFFIVSGVIFILIHKIEMGKSLIPMTFHSIFGSLGLLLIMIQAISGFRKMDNFKVSNFKIHRWHGDIGLLTWDVCILACVLGVFSFMGWFSLYAVALCWLIQGCWFIIHIAVMKQKDGESATEEETELRDPSSSV